ncbi:MAG: HD domain-containing protein [Actinomycetia bacterium]|nr:HD domain-containing protein [Actinomycetes bacterium]
MQHRGETNIEVAHRAVPVGPAGFLPFDRAARESEGLSPGTVGRAPHAARASGAGTRQRAEEPDLLRTCFERDLDRIKHSRPFRRLAGKCQVYIDPDDDHLRTRLTHAIEVAQVAVSIARAVGLDVSLTEAAAIGHDCGHGPAGHASEGALSPFVLGGYHHAVYGADVVLEPLNLCVETLDAIREHSWNRPGAQTPEGEVVAWADRIAYVCHDFEDAVSAGVVSPADLPTSVTEVVGVDRRSQLHRFITAMVDTIATTGTVGMRRPEADALAAFRDFNFDRIYLRPAAVTQADQVSLLIGQLTEFFIAYPLEMDASLQAGSTEAVEAAVRWVSGMTDRFALDLAVHHLGWAAERLPRGVLTGY